MAGIAPDAVAYSAAVEACARGGLNDEAETVVQQMKNEGLRPTAQVRYHPPHSTLQDIMSRVHDREVAW